MIFRIRRDLLLPSLLSGVLWLGACSDAPRPEEAMTPPAANGLMSITAGPDLLAELKIGEPRLTSVTGTLRVYGRVEADETRLARVSSPVTGRVIELEVVEGQRVKRGDLIAVIRSTELANAQSNYLKADSQRQLAQRAVDRAKRLLDAGVIGEAELQRREGEYIQIAAEFSASRDELRVLGMTDLAVARLQETRVVNAVSQVVASIDGTVMDRPVTLGQVVQAAESICILADLSHVWLVADVPEQTAGSLSVGKAVESEIAALPGEIIRGTLTFVSAIVNPETRTVRARMDLPNPEGRYKPAMLATLTLQDLAETQQVIPATAVVREGNEEYLFVQITENRFLLRKVRLGGEFGSVRVLLEGLQEGEKIVLDGAFHLNNERKRAALQGS
ncbi:MAG TPA: efflux RND transporter periplasmic adaptor subunit [Bryobacteraceae bacterium]|nr:efflux transporter periplasmic adaptor subunit [Bryobacterales bacterium]HRJ20746.1 efflux RND transporter periplasmic adaptor subunit [Bryobacteraceae bacterium]